MLLKKSPTAEKPAAQFWQARIRERTHVEARLIRPVSDSSTAAITDMTEAKTLYTKNVRSRFIIFLGGPTKIGFTDNIAAAKLPPVVVVCGVVWRFCRN